MTHACEMPCDRMICACELQLVAEHEDEHMSRWVENDLHDATRRGSTDEHAVHATVALSCNVHQLSICTSEGCFALRIDTKVSSHEAPSTDAAQARLKCRQKASTSLQLSDFKAAFGN